MRSAEGFRGEHSGRKVLFDELIQVKTKFGVELELDTRTTPKRSNP
jgi:hypothetical protein